jgi:CubicO group peptidase (beta-lactamase class C family)
MDLSQIQPIDTYEELMDYLARSGYDLLGAPGDWFNYSNDGYGLLAAIVERVSGQTYPSFVTEQILNPAGMENSTFDISGLGCFPRSDNPICRPWK